MPKEAGPSGLFSLKEWKHSFLPLPGTVRAARSQECSDLLALLAPASLFFPGFCSDFKQALASLLVNGFRAVLRQL